MNADADRKPVACANAAALTNVDAILNEIRHALEELLDWGRQTIIDLSALPVGTADLKRLDDTLGTGEVAAAVDAAGTSRVQETGYPGVWLIEHLDDDGAVRARQLHITFVPELLTSDPSDISDGLRTLTAGLERRPPPKTE